MTPTQPTSDNQSSQAYLDSLYAETKDLTSFTMKWDDISLKLFLEYNAVDSLARERAMHTTIGRKISEEQLKAELAEIRKTADDTMNSVWKILTMREVNLFVEVKQPGMEKKKLSMSLNEFDQFCKTIHPESELLWWPTHFKTYQEASEYVTINLEKK